MTLGYYPGMTEPYSAWMIGMNTNESLNRIGSLLKDQSKMTQGIKSGMESYSSDMKVEYRNSINQLSSEINNSLKQCTSLICGSLDEGFDLISQDIREVGRSLDYRLALLHEQSVLNNLISQNIALLLRIPDIQKERQYFLEQGVKHLRNAIIDNDFYENALECLLEAEKREKTDYVVLHLLGTIFLFSPQFKDLGKAEAYFKKAAKFAKVETDPNAYRLADILGGNTLSRLEKNIPSQEKMRVVASESLFQAGIVCQLLGKMKEARDCFKEAYELVPTLFDIVYQLGLTNALLNNASDTIKYFNQALSINRRMSVLVASNPFLVEKDFVQKWLKMIRDQEHDLVSMIIKERSKKAIENSVYIGDIHEINNVIDGASYLDLIRIKKYIYDECLIDSEVQVYNRNIEKLNTLREIVQINNDLPQNIGKGVQIEGYLSISLEMLEKVYNDINSKTTNQWLISDMISVLANQVDKTLTKNRSLISNRIDALKKTIPTVEELNRARQNSLTNAAIFAKIVMVILALTLGFIGCKKTAELPNYGGGLFMPLVAWGAIVGSFFGLYKLIILLIDKAENKKARIPSRMKSILELIDKLEKVRYSFYPKNIGKDFNISEETPKNHQSFNSFWTNRLLDRGLSS